MAAIWFFGFSWGGFGGAEGDPAACAVFAELGVSLFAAATASDLMPGQRREMLV